MLLLLPVLVRMMMLRADTQEHPLLLVLVRVLVLRADTREHPPVLVPGIATRMTVVIWTASAVPKIFQEPRNITDDPVAGLRYSKKGLLRFLL